LKEVWIFLKKVEIDPTETNKGSFAQ